MCTCAPLAGTKEPICASTTHIPSARMNVLLPPIFGPVRMHVAVFADTVTSLGM